MSYVQYGKEKSLFKLNQQMSLALHWLVRNVCSGFHA